MSIYEYVCKNCRKKFQEIVPINEYGRKKTVCPKCRSARVDRVWGAVNVVTSRKS